MTGFLQTTKDYYDTNVLRFNFSDSDALKKLDKKYADFTNNGSVFENLDTKQSVISLSATDICDRWLNPYAQTDIEKAKFKSADGEKRSYIYDLKRNIYEDKQGDCRYEIFLADTSQNDGYYAERRCFA